jgi:hypothetical protein
MFDNKRIYKHQKSPLSVRLNFAKNSCHWRNMESDRNCAAAKQEGNTWMVHLAILSLGSLLPWRRSANHRTSAGGGEKKS